MTARVAKLKPLTDMELRDATIRDYRNNALRSGLQPDMSAIEQLVQFDLNLVDGFERDEKRTPVGAPSTPAPVRRSDPLAEHMQEHGLRETSPGREERPDPMLDVSPQRHGERFGFAMGRIRRILEPRGVVKAAARSWVEAVVAEASYPKLAEKYVNLWCWYQLRAWPSPSNPFWGLSDSDAWRKFRRGVEDVCDESTKEPGLLHWYTR